MPRSFSSSAGDAGKEALRRFGPLVAVEISRRGAGTMVGGSPETIHGLGCIDTGAWTSAVDKTVVDALSLEPVEAMTTSTPIGTAELMAYPLRLAILDIDLSLELRYVAGVDLSGAFADRGNGPEPIIALIGRDVLARCVFTYDGPGAAFTISA